MSVRAKAQAHHQFTRLNITRLQDTHCTHTVSHMHIHIQPIWKICIPSVIPKAESKVSTKTTLSIIQYLFCICTIKLVVHRSRVLLFWFRAERRSHIYYALSLSWSFRRSRSRSRCRRLYDRFTYKKTKLCQRNTFKIYQQKQNTQSQRVNSPALLASRQKLYPTHINITVANWMRKWAGAKKSETVYIK